MNMILVAVSGNGTIGPYFHGCHSINEALRLAFLTS